VEICTELPSLQQEIRREFRVFVVLSREDLIASRFSTVICAPVYSIHHGLSTQVSVGIDEGLKHESAIHCDELVSLPKPALTDFVGSLPPDKLAAVNEALKIALELTGAPNV
jgi:mRNA interferase MazF